jgi:drug/metabolite transporter (DMT)-like permease
LNASIRGLWLGAAGVVVFSLTMPMTRLALEGEGLSPWFVWAGRTVLAVAAGVIYLTATRTTWPPRPAWWPLAGATAGIVLGWPLLNTIALQWVPASHAAVLNGVLPLMTAMLGAWFGRERLSRGFWLCAVAGTLLVCGYAWFRGGSGFSLADGLILVSLALGGLGYAAGAIATRHMSGPAVISWALILGLPCTLPVALASAPDWRAPSATAWLAFAYLGLMSQWVGFLFWYRGLALGGIARVSQVQLMQLFGTLAFSALLLGERIDLAMGVVAAMTVGLIALGRRAR